MNQFEREHTQYALNLLSQGPLSLADTWLVSAALGHIYITEPDPAFLPPIQAAEICPVCHPNMDFNTMYERITGLTPNFAQGATSRDDSN